MEICLKYLKVSLKEFLRTTLKKLFMGLLKQFMEDFLKKIPLAILKEITEKIQKKPLKKNI